MPHASALSFSWLEEQSKAKQTSGEVGPRRPPCATASALLLQPQLRVSPSRKLLIGNHFFANRLQKNPKGNLKKKKTFPDSHRTLFHCLQSTSSLGLSFARGATGDSRPSEMPFPAVPLSPHSTPFLQSPWATEGHLKFIINNVEHLTPKGRAQRSQVCPSLFLPLG